MMKNIGISHWMVFLIMSFGLGGCKDKMQDPVRPFSIMTELKKDHNHIKNIFALPNNTLVVTSMKQYGVFLFNKDLLHLKQYIFEDRTEIAGPFLLDDQHFGIIADEVTKGETNVYKFDFQLNMVQKRRIDHLFLNVFSTVRYYAFAAAAPDGSTIIANTNDRIPGAKISVISIKNIMEDNQRAWSWLAPNWSGDWLNNLHIGQDGSVYLTGYPNPGNENFLIKINKGGTFGFRRAFPHVVSGGQMFTYENRLLYQDNLNIYDLDLDGNLRQTVNFQSTQWQGVSNIISSGSNFYLYKDTFTLDGKFVALYKLGQDLRIEKVRILGNQGTNSQAPYRNLVKMPSGEMVFSVLIENPDLSGNHWYFAKFDEDLKLEGEE